LAQADKGKTSLVIYKKDYDQNIQNFITENEIHPKPKNPINKDCKIIRDSLQKSNVIFTKGQIRHLTQKKPIPPRLNARIKIHKPDNPIKPVINNKNAPTYKLTKKTEQHTQTTTTTGK